MALIANVTSGDTILPSWGNAIRDQGVQVCTSGARPGTPAEGMVIYQTDTDTFAVYSGSAWIEFGGLKTWTTWTPVVKIGATTATVANIGSRTRRTGDAIDAVLAVRFTNLNGGTGNVTVVRPVTGASSSVDTGVATYTDPLGRAMLTDISSGAIYGMDVTPNLADGSDVVIRQAGAPSAGALTHASPITIAVGAASTGDELRMRLRYDLPM